MSFHSEPILLQIPQVFLFDVLKTGVLRALAPVLASEAVRKVMHDCREDASSFYHQYGIRLRNVFDTQAGLESFKRSLTRAREPLHIFVNSY